ncbi:MAG: chemotaxis protein CheC [Planctomycetes bacterium]|nr:chemotaxis protein CheC [Planctomycetota bacterium]
MRMTSEQQDVITELINVGVGRAAASLSELLGQRIELRVPAVTICNISDLSERLLDEESGVDLSVVQDFKGGLSGRAMLAFPRSSGVELGKVLGEVDSPNEELSIDLIGILEEVGNIVLNGVLGTIGNMTSLALDYSVPRLAQGVEVTRMLTSHASEQDDMEQMVILAETRFNVAEDSITGSLILLFDIQSLRSIMRNLIEPAAECE